MLRVAIRTLLSALFVVTTAVSADDTEIFFPRTVDFEYTGTGVAPPNPNYPNVLFILDASWSMSHSDAGQVGNRISRLREAMSTILNSAEGVNIGLMRFSKNQSGARVIYPMSPIEHAREDAKTVINNMGLDWHTPTIGALIESGFYWTGSPVHFGRTRYSKPSDQHRNLAQGRISHPDSYTGGTIVRDNPLCTGANPDDPACIEERIDGDATYISPVVSECQKNYQVLINDGGASDFGSRALAENFLDASCADAGDNTCGVELADYLATEDIAPHLPGDSHVTTYTVGFNARIDALKAIAAAGGGEYFESSSAEQLATALSTVLVEAAGGNRSFAAPAITMDQTTRLSHRDDIYVALFQPEVNQRWSGNLKRYRFDGELLDVNGAVAMDATGGAIKGTAQSYWSDIADGNIVTEGGAASRLDRARRVFTYTGGSSVLADDDNALNETNTNITAAMLNVPAAEVSNLLRWARGLDVDDEYPGNHRRPEMGDPLHSRPAILTYGANRSETAVFIGTNEGYLHAIDATTGNEIFSFVPPELLGTLNDHYQNPVTTNRTYGLDGDLTLWVNESSTGDIDHAYLYMGMRRGGRNYTALDVTNPVAPKYLWSINAGDPGFEKLGQTWSKPTLGNIELNGEATRVLIFGGGYDPRQDNLTVRSADTMGNDLFMVNAETGALLWSTANDPISYGAMKYSIPSDVSVIDSNSDGFTDQVYVGDMGGQIWRLDIDNQASTAIPSVTGGVIAETANDGRFGMRRFFSRPDISLVSDGDTHFLSVAIGTGARSRPLRSVVNNQFYMIRQKSIYGKPEGYGILDKTKSTETTRVFRPINELDLYDVTPNLVDSTNAIVANDARDALNEAQGWRLDLQGDGEKSLAPSLTLDNQVTFTTYLPNAAVTDPCAPSIGGGRTYSVNVFDGTPSTGTDTSDRYTMLETMGIPPEPVAHIDGDGNVQILVGMEAVDTPNIDLTRRTYWAEQPDY